MDAIAKARNKYKEYRDCKSSWLESCDQKESNLELEVKNSIFIAVKGASSPSKLFHSVQILEILKQALQKQAANNADVQPVTKAYSNLELYFVLLVEQPWKPEFKKLKMYGGFYRTKIKSVLPEPENIFKMAGYDIDKSKNLLVLKKPAQREILLTLAFDCRMAATLCSNIEDHYKKLRNLDKSVGDAISDILDDPSFSALSMKPRIINYSLKSGGVGTMIAPTPSVSAKRELPLPHVNGIAEVPTPPSISLSHQQAQYNRVLPRPASMSIGTSSSRNVLFNSLTPQYIQGAPVAAVTGGRIPSSAGPPVMVDDNLVCTADPHAEILPNFPELTTEEHMRESLKMMEGQRSSKHLDDTSSEPNSRNANTFDEFAWSHQSQLTVPAGSNRQSALTYPPGAYIGVKNHMPISVLDNASIDEGIGGEMSTVSNSKPSSRCHLTADAQSILPSKNLVTMMLHQQQPFSVDQGYRTGPEAALYVPPSLKNSSIPGMPSRKIYHPPEVDAPSASDLGVQLRSRQASSNVVAPPIPPRELKPTYSTLPQRYIGEDMADGLVSETTTTAAKGSAHANLNGALRRQVHGGLSLVGVTVNSQTQGICDPQNYFPQNSDLEPSLRRSRISSTGRSGSLKTDEPRSLLAQEVSQARAARSMEITDTSWQCRSCTTRNSALVNVCVVCSHSRRGLAGSEWTQLPKEESSGVACKKCTFANAPGRTRCEMCQNPLEFSYMR